MKRLQNPHTHTQNKRHILNLEVHILQEMYINLTSHQCHHVYLQEAPLRQRR